MPLTTRMSISGTHSRTAFPASVMSRPGPQALLTQPDCSVVIFPSLKSDSGVGSDAGLGVLG